MGPMVHGANGLHVVRIVRGTNSQWYEKSRHREKLWSTTISFSRLLQLMFVQGSFCFAVYISRAY